MFKLAFALLAISAPARLQVSPANLAALHAAAESALAARDLAKAGATSKLLQEAAMDSENLPETAFAESISGQVQTAEGNYGVALQTLNRALELYRTERDDSGYAKVLVQQAVAYRFIGQSGKSLEALREARNIFEKEQNREEIAHCDLETGNVYITIDNYRSALEALQRALQMAEEVDQPRLIASITNSIGSVYYHQANRELALEFYQRSLQVREKYSNYYEIISTLVNISAADISLHRLPDAYAALDRALALSRPEDPRSRAQVLNRYARVLFADKKYEQALARANEGIELLAGNRDPQLETDTLIRVGQAQSELGHFEEGIKAAEKALAIPEANQSLLFKILALEVRGVAQLNLNRNEDAYATFKDLIEVHERARENVAGDAAQVQAYLRSEGDEMHGAVEALIRLKRYQEAFQMTERNKGRALLTVLGADDERLTSHLTADERTREARLQQNVVDANVSLEQAHRASTGSGRIRELETIVQRARLDLDAFDTTLYAVHPELQMHRNRAATVTAEEAARMLPDSRTVLLEYDLGPDGGYIFSLSRSPEGTTKLNIHKLNIKRDDLNAQVNEFRKKISERDLGFREDARKLYQMLIEPAAADLAGKETLIITPDSILWQLPFQALATGSNQSLIEKFAIFFAPSITVLSRLKQPVSAGTRQPVLFAAGDSAVGLELPSLKSIYGAESQVITGTAATENAVKQNATQFRIVHLAAHGFYDDAHPMNSYLQLSRPNDDSEDGRLEARELMSMDLKADVVVLSACETARGEAAGGEGLVGMTWALLVAGVPTAVASQWKVDAGSTAELMIRFHRALKESDFMSKAKALQQAAVSVMKDPQYRHPFYWAGFVMVGTGF